MLQPLGISNKKYSASIIGVFLLAWVILNIIQASFMELHADEAYYWVYSKLLAWGYFDHPPMVALYIKAGDSLFHTLLGLRLVTIFSTTLAIYFLWKIVCEYAENAKLFVLMIAGFLLFHVYGFITTPDAPLFLFTILFYYVYRKYLNRDKIKWMAALSIIIALMLYSKYHGVLILFFTILSNVKLLKRPSFWVIVGLSAVLFFPHIWWQIENGFPSLKFHLLDRSSRAYRLKNTIEYFFGQLLVSSPLLSWFYFKISFQAKPVDGFIRTIKFHFLGIFIFFLFSTLKDDVEPHWTLIGYPSVFILSYIYLAKKELPRWFVRLSIVNIALILLVRMIFIVPLPFFERFKIVKNQSGFSEWAKQVKAKAGNEYVVFTGGFQEASQYNYYNNTLKGFSYDSRYYRKTQFDMWPLEDSIRHKKVYYVQSSPHPVVKQDSFQTAKGEKYGMWIENARLYQKVEIDVSPTGKNWKKNELRQLILKIYNPYDETINFSNQNEMWKCYLEYGYKENNKLIEVFPLKSQFNNLTIPSKQYASIRVGVKAPAKPGKYQLIFSIRTEPFPGSRNSPMLSINVK